MWKAAFESGKKAPILGPGKDEYQRTVKSGVETGDFIKKAGTHHFPHSEYAAAFGYHGIAGLISFILILLVPWRIFWKKWLSADENDMRAVALTGLLVVIMFAVFSLTDSPFEQRSTIMFYALMVIIPLTVRSTSSES
jgi:O-antigen ligase